MKQRDRTHPANDDRARFPGEPVKTDFMDAGLRELWNRLGPMPEDLRLIGGTALALYLNHRPSTDLDFATPAGVIDHHMATAIPGFERPVSIDGGAGLIGLNIRSGREVVVTLMQCGPFVPPPKYAPRAAPNSVQVAAPADLVCSKLVATIQRDAPRDFVDLAAAEQRWPGIIAHGVELATAGTYHSRSALLARLAAPPMKTAARLDGRVLAALRTAARRLAPPTAEAARATPPRRQQGQGPND